MIKREIELATAEELEDFEKNMWLWLENFEFKVVLFKALGLSIEAITDLINSNFTVLRSNNVAFQLYQAQRSNDPLIIQELVKDISCEIKRIDNVNCVWIYRYEEIGNIFDEDHLRELLYPHFPDKITRITKIIIGGSAGKPLLEFRSGGTRHAKIIESILIFYDKWFKENAQLITPQFIEIRNEIGTWLDKNYSINPQQYGFIPWFIHVRLNKRLWVHWKAEKLDESGRMRVDLNIDYSDLIQEFSTTVIDKDLHEYCKYRQEQQEAIMVGGGTPILIPASNTEHITTGFPTETLIQIMIPNCQRRFIEMEERLIEKGYIDVSGKWKGKAIELAAFLFVIKEDRNLVKTNIKGYVRLRKFFSNRYNFKIPPDYVKPSRLNPMHNRSIGTLLSELS